MPHVFRIIDTISGLADTTIAGIADGDLLVYKVATSSWENEAAGAGYVPYVGAVANVNLGTFNLTTTGTVDASAHNITDKKVTVTTFTSAGINAAIDALGTEGGEVYIPEGDYDFGIAPTGIVIDYDNTIIRGAGKGTRLLNTCRFVYTTIVGVPAAGETITGDTTGFTATVVKVDLTNKIVWYHTLSNGANYNAAEVISWSGGADTTINGVVPTEPTEHAVDFSGKDYITITDLTVYGGRGADADRFLIVGTSSSNATIQNCNLLYGDEAAINVTGDFLKVQFNYIIGCNDEGVVCFGIDNADISHNYIEDCGIPTSNPAISVPQCNNVTVSDNVLKSNHIAIAVDAVATHVVITNNVVQTTASDGITVLGGSKYCTISNNNIYDVDSGSADIKLNAADYCTVIGNNLYGDGTSDIGIHLDESDYCTVTGNFSDNHDVAGIQEDADCQNNIIAGNNVQDGYVLNGATAETFDFGNSSLLSTGDVRIVSDSNQIELGNVAGGDMIIKYGGSSGLIDTSIVAASDLNIACGANKTLVLNNTVWDELPPTPITSAKLGSTAPTLTTFVSDIEQYTFDASNDYVIGATEITHRWKEGTTIHPHIHWATNGLELAAKGVKWQLSWCIGGPGGVFSAQTVSVIDVEIPGSTTDRTHFLNHFSPTVDGTGYKIDTYILWRLERIATAHINGEPAANPFGLAVGFHAEQETIGSRDITTK